MDYFDFDFDMQSLDEGSDSDVATAFAKNTPVGTPIEKPESDTSEHVTMSVSYVFHPYTFFDNCIPDLVLVSLDKVFFYVHSQKILTASDNGFAMLLPTYSALTMDKDPATVVVPEPADVLNIVIHTIYGMSAVEYRPAFDTVSATLDALSRCGLSPKRYVSVGQPLYDLVVSCAPHHPIDTYALAAAHDLFDAAAAASAHLLSFILSNLSDELAARIGSVYLKKLFFLHFGRVEALKCVLLQPPSAHSDTLECSPMQQQCLTRAWALAVSSIMWDARPNLSTHLLQASLLPLQKDLTCPKCKLCLRDRVAGLVIEWASVKRTI